ncbi:protein-glutamate O-methyltransferase CheR [bacterium]|nr:protein-glutamate O-methyltransferase CheR [bacterium]
MNIPSALSSFVLNRFGINLNPEKTEAVLSFLKETKGLSEDNLIAAINTDSILLYDLINKIVVPETYFFRNIEHILILIDILTKEFMGRKSLMFLSAGCSTGEEAYTLAILLKEKFPHLYENSMIYGIDLNPKSIEKAKHGVYTKSSIRNDMMGIGKKHIKRLSPYEYRLSDEIRGKVIFKQGNLLDYDYSCWTKQYDIILCRNVFIYFDTDHILKALNRYYDIMHENSYLFVGHSEMINQISTEFQPLLLRNSFVFQKAVEKSPASENDLIIESKPPKKADKRTERPKSKTLTSVAVEENEMRLEKIREKISEESYADAKEMVNKYLENYPTSLHASILSATLLLFDQKHDEALKLIDSIVKVPETKYYIFFLKGILFSETGDFSMSIKFFKLALVENPTCLISNFFLGFIHEEKRYYRISLKYYTETIRNKSLFIKDSVQKIMPHLSAKQLRDLAQKKYTALKIKEATL